MMISDFRSNIRDKKSSIKVSEESDDLLNCCNMFDVILRCPLQTSNSNHKINKSKIVIFEAISTTFEAIIIFWGSWDSFEEWLDLKTKP